MTKLVAIVDIQSMIDFFFFVFSNKLNERKKNILLQVDYAKAFDCVDHNKLWKILKEMGIPDHLTCLLRNLYSGQEETELDMEQQTGSKLGREYVKAVYCHLVYLTYMQSTSCKMLDCMYQQHFLQHQNQKFYNLYGHKKDYEYPE